MTDWILLVSVLLLGPVLGLAAVWADGRMTIPRVLTRRVSRQRRHCPEFRAGGCRGSSVRVVGAAVRLRLRSLFLLTIDC